MAHTEKKQLCATLVVQQLSRLLFNLLVWSLGCGLFPVSAAAQVQGKPYQQWTAKEVEGLLFDSAWAQTRIGLVSAGRSDPPTETVDTTVTLRLQSALPVRQAQARLKQLKANYDKKSDSDRAAIDATTKTLLECQDCADYYVVEVSPGPKSKNGMPRSLERMSLAQLKLNVHLQNEKGETRELAKFIDPRFNDERAVFFFSRFDAKGEPLITAANRTLTISFESHIFESTTWSVTKFEFDVARMTFKGQVVF